MPPRLRLAAARALALLQVAWQGRPPAPNVVLVIAAQQADLSSAQVLSSQQEGKAKQQGSKEDWRGDTMLECYRPQIAMWEGNLEGMKPGMF